jgi:hypothetical protein
MEYVEGVNLADYLAQKGPLPVALACHFIRQAALGLQHAHEQGMVHRDVKPQNLMLTRKGQVKILDFGLARLASERGNRQGLTQVGSFMDTPEYVAPEQATDARSADIRADVYSLGCTLYALLTGRPPFVEDTVVKLVVAHLEKEPPPLRSLRPEVSEGLAAVVARMLSKNPARRFQTPGEVAATLMSFCQKEAEQPTAVAAATVTVRVATSVPTRTAADFDDIQVAQEPGHTHRLPTRRRSRRAGLSPSAKLLAPTAAIAVVAILVLGVYFATRPPSADPVDRNLGRTLPAKQTERNPGRPLPSSARIAAPPTRLDLLAYYRFEEGTGSTAVNEGKSGGPGSHSASYVMDSPGGTVPQTRQANKFALEFQKPGMVAAFPSKFVFHRGCGDGTLEFWVKPRGRQENASLFWSTLDPGDTNRFNIYLGGAGGDRLGCDYRSPSGQLHTLLQANGPFRVAPDSWFHVAITRKGVVYSFFGNGSLVATAADTDPDLPTSTGWTINGRDGGHQGCCFLGQIDEVRCMSRALLPKEFLNAGMEQAGRAR